MYILVHILRLTQLTFDTDIHVHVPRQPGTCIVPQFLAPTLQNSTFNKKDRWDSGKPRRQQILFYDIQIKVVTSRMQIYVYHSDLQLRKIWVTLTLTFQGR